MENRDGGLPQRNEIPMMNPMSAETSQPKPEPGPKPEPTVQQVDSNGELVFKKFLGIDIEPLNLIDLFIVVICGITLIIATTNNHTDIVYTIVVGFMGYLGATARGVVRKGPTNTPTGRD